MHSKYESLQFYKKLKRVMQIKFWINVRLKFKKNNNNRRKKLVQGAKKKIFRESSVFDNFLNRPLQEI